MSAKQTVVFKPDHEEPRDFYLGYILLPFGMYYEKTYKFLKAKQGDILRFYNGPEYPINRVLLISEPVMCETLCRMRYGISWEAAYNKWLSYARLEGHGKDIIVKNMCIAVFYEC